MSSDVQKIRDLENFEARFFGGDWQEKKKVVEAMKALGWTMEKDALVDELYDLRNKLLEDLDLKDSDITIEDSEEQEEFVTILSEHGNKVKVLLPRELQWYD